MKTSYASLLEMFHFSTEMKYHKLEYMSFIHQVLNQIDESK